MNDHDKYITVVPAVKAGKWCVQVVSEMADDNYLVVRSSDPLTSQAALALAHSWAAAMKLDIR